MIRLQKSVIGMIHVPALPGTPAHSKSVIEIIQEALQETEIYTAAGIDALLLENMHDLPYLKNSVGHEISSLMAIIAYEVKKQSHLPCGIQILAGANEAALAAAHSAGLDFIRAEGFVYGHLADEGYMDACAGPLLRYRKQIGADNISILTDIKKKHSSHAITADVDLADTAKTAEFFKSDGLIITGSHTGEETEIDDLIKVRKHTALPIIIGSGVTIDNIGRYFPLCDAFIVGSHFKKNGRWDDSLDEARVRRFISKIKTL